MASPQSDSSLIVSSHSAIYLCNIKQLVPIVLDHTNYTLWRALLIPVFKGYNVYGFIDGTCPCPQPTATVSDSLNYQQWTQIDSIVLSWIQATISQEIIQQIVKPDHVLTSRDTWLRIELLLRDKQHSKAVTKVDAKKMLLRCRRICKHSAGTTTSTPFIRFGPLYGPGEDKTQEKRIQDAKDEIWHNILRSSPGNEEQTKGLFTYAIRSIEKEAREAYDSSETSFLQLTGTEFRWMMIKDGCFFLHLALLILLHDPRVLPAHKFSGELLQTKKHECIASMFHVGNQIPLLVLKSLMKQSYFQGEIMKFCKWPKRPSSDLVKIALYNSLLLPIEREQRNNNHIPPSLQFLFPTKSLELPCDVLHGLHLLLIGPEIQDQLDHENDDDDVAEIDLEAGHDDSATPMLRKASDSGSTSSELKKEYRSASELKQAGIKFKVFEGIGIKGISFRKRYYPCDPYLALPPFFVDAHSKMLLQSLKDYEAAQNFDGNQCEVTSYLRFMHELIQTTEDARVLHLSGVIKGSWRHTEKIPRILVEIAGDEEMITCPKLRLAKFQVNYYDRPRWFTMMSNYFSIIFALTVIQTVYTMLQYHDQK